MIQLTAFDIDFHIKYLGVSAFSTRSTFINEMNRGRVRTALMNRLSWFGPYKIARFRPGLAVLLPDRVWYAYELPRDCLAEEVPALRGRYSGDLLLCLLCT